MASRESAQVFSWKPNTKTKGIAIMGGGKACVISILIRIETVFTIRSHLQPLPDVVLFPQTELMNSIRHFSSFFFCLLSLLYTNANFLFRSRRRRLAHVIIWITCSFSFLTCKLTSRELTFCWWKGVISLTSVNYRQWSNHVDVKVRILTGRKKERRYRPNEGSY